MKVSKRFALAACGIGVATSLIGASVANADPTAPPANAFDRPLHGEGSDTTEEVMNGLAEVVVDGAGNKLFASWNAKGSTGFTTRSAANTPAGSNCTYTGNPTPDSSYVQGARANGSGNGQRALRDAFTAGQSTFGCLDFSRSSSNPSVGNLGTVQVAAVPLATDSLTFAISRTSAIPRQLTKAQLQGIYHCTFGGTTTGAWKALIPQAGSGTRSSWLGMVGLTEADLTPAGSFPCVTDQADFGTRGGGNPIQEHDSRVVNNNSIAPVSVAAWVSQMGGAATDLRGSTMLGTIKSTGAPAILSYPVGLNPTYGNVGVAADNFSATRTVYNVLPTSTLPGGANPNANAILAFIDTDPGAANTSLICQRSDIISKFGYGPIATCGSTANVIN